MKKRFIGLLIFAVILWTLPFFTSACDVHSHASNYVKQIHTALRGSKPRLVIFSGKDSDAYAFYKDNTIHIYKGDYKGKCSKTLPFLKSVIAHEYGHHIENKLQKASRLRKEKLVRVAEHAIADEIWGDAKYDNEADLNYPKDYQEIRQMLIKRIAQKRLAHTGKKGLFLKSKRLSK